MTAPRIEPGRLAAPGSLAAALLAGRPAVSELLPLLRPAEVSREALPAARRGRAMRFPTDVLRTTTVAAAERLERIAAGNGVLVSTGQQPILFLGPLYVLYKVLTAQRVAALLERELGVPALALFWIASDDHDWEEVAATHLIDRRGGVRRFALEPPPGHEGRSVGPAPLPDSVAGTVSDFLETLGESDFSDPYRQILHDCYRAGVSFADAFAACLQSVIGDTDLALLDAASPLLRERSRPFLREALERRIELEPVMAAAHRDVEEAGYRPQLAYIPDALEVFFDTGERRERLYSEGQGLRIGRSGESRTAAEILSLLDDEPDRFSPSAALRPALESWLAPVAVSVLGPGEMAYWSQLKGLFALLGVPQPRVTARDSWRVVERRIGRVIEKIGASPEDLADGGAEISNRLVGSLRPASVYEATQALQRDVQRGFAVLEEAVVHELPGARSAAGKAKSATHGALTDFLRTADGQVREREATLLDQVRRASIHLYPERTSQERVLSPFFYLHRYGDRFLQALREAAAAGDSGVSGGVAGGSRRK